MWRTLAKRRAWREGSAVSSVAPRWAARLRSHGSCSAPSTTSSSAHTSRSGSHASASGSIPEATATASSASRRGDGNSTFAQTPSARPGVTPSPVESRWVSQRSIPRVGTAITSGANGSSSGSRQQRGEGAHEPVGPLGSVDVQHGRSHIRAAARRSRPRC